MLKDLEELLRPRERAVELGPHKLTVRECPSAADLSPAAAAGAGEDMLGWLLLVRCTFDEAGAPVFTEADIPALKAGSKWKLGPLIAAVNYVNGFDEAAETKNFSAAPA